jgi:glycerophosphoryl diester phosphodiesterase
MNPNQIIIEDAKHPYPRLCAHRGLRSAAPDNSLPAFGAAIALGADEIELDVLPTKDGVLVSMHDRKLAKISDGTGLEYEYTYGELLKLDFGVKFSEEYRGLRVLTFEEVLRKLGRSVIMNVHMKMWDVDIGEPDYEKVAALIRKYECENYVYLTSISLEKMEAFHKVAPEIERCYAFNCIKSDPYKCIDICAEMGIGKIQISDPSREIIECAHSKGLIVNIYYADDPEKAREYLNMGADTILSNNILRIMPVF